MALVLLRFPDAPKEYRAGVYEAMREEQAHDRDEIAALVAAFEAERDAGACELLVGGRQDDAFG